MVAEFVIALAELLEAEARAARIAFARLWGALALIAAAALLGLAGVGLILWSVYLAMLHILAPPAAAFLTALLVFLIVGAILLAAMRLVIR